MTPDRFLSGVSAYLATWSLTLKSSSHTLMHQESHYCSIPAPNLSKIPTWQIEKEAHKYHLAMCLYLWLSHAIWTFTLIDTVIFCMYILCTLQNTEQNSPPSCKIFSSPVVIVLHIFAVFLLCHPHLCLHVSKLYILHIIILSLTQLQ